MGKGTIISGGTDGQYQVQINYARDKYTYMLSELESKITEYEGKISAKQSEINILYIGINGLNIPAYNARIKAIQKAEMEKNTLTLIKLSFEKRKSYLENNMPDDETISAWCADLTDDLSGTVGLIEIPGESEDFNIQPGYDGNAVYSSTRDGQLMPTVVQTSAQAFYNLAMLPGWQKWMPTYRYGTITAINEDTADVSLDSTTSSQQSINVNQAETLSDVDIEYMECHGAAFEVGDEVLIQFLEQDFEAPKIIGFKSEPKACYENKLICTFNGAAPTNGGEIIKLVYTHSDEHESTQFLTIAASTGKSTQEIEIVTDSITGEKIDPVIFLRFNKTFSAPGEIDTNENLLFDYFTEVVDGDFPLRGNYQYDNPSSPTFWTKGFYLSVNETSPDKIVNRVEYCRYEDTLSECTTSISEDDEQLYHVDFVDLKRIYRQYNSYNWRCYPGNIKGEGEPELFEMLLVESWISGLNSVVIYEPSPSGFLNDDTDDSGGVWCQSIGFYTYIDSVSPDDISGFIILSDEDGQSPTYPGCTAMANGRGSCQCLTAYDTWPEICATEETNVIAWAEYIYTMGDTPTELF